MSDDPCVTRLADVETLSDTSLAPPPMKWSRVYICRYFVHRALGSPFFDLFIGLVIVLNSVLIGVETHMKAQGQSSELFGVADVFFLAIYILELISRFFAHHLHCLKSGWVIFDFLLVTESAPANT